VLGVFLVHTGQRVEGLPGSVDAFTNFGAYGVHLFFVASAFTLFASLSRRSSSESRPTLNYFLRRFFRIAPLFWLALLFYVRWNGTGPQYWAPHGIGWADVLATACFAHGWSPTMINSVVPGGWSIAVEMNFYLLVPWLFRRLTSVRRAVWFFLISMVFQAVVTAAMRPVFLRHLAPDEQYLGPLMEALWLPAQLPVFAAGFVLYRWLLPDSARHGGGASLPSARWPAWPGFVLLGTALGFCLAGLAPTSTFWGTAFAIFAAGLALHPSSFLVNGFTRYLGDISYSGYLVHFAVLDVAERVLRHFTPLARYPLPHLAVLYGAVVFGTILVATVTTRLIERPARGTGRSLIAALERRHRPPALELSA
jgi:peptidoglycan/LPS O-acetylase OafA/YrhL